MPDVPPGKWWKRPRVVESLAITAEQQEKLDATFAKNRRAFIDLKADVEKRQLDLEELLTKKGTDSKRISDATDALEQSRGRLGKARTMMIVDMKGILTDEQWKKINDSREQWRREGSEDRRSRMERSGRGPGGFGSPGRSTPGAGVPAPDAPQKPATN
jgi:Spy/CpxP family protein refolding chaperone